MELGTVSNVAPAYASVEFVSTTVADVRVLELEPVLADENEGRVLEFRACEYPWCAELSCDIWCNGRPKLAGGTAMYRSDGLPAGSEVQAKDHHEALFYVYGDLESPRKRDLIHCVGSTAGLYWWIETSVVRKNTLSGQMPSALEATL